VTVTHRNPQANASAQTVSESYAAVCANLRIKIKDRFIHPYIAGYWPKCLSVDRMNRAQLLELQENRLRELMQHAIRHVPFYRRWARQAGHTFENPPPLNAWPIATKDLFRANLDAFQSEAFPLNGMSLAKTSGSSGEPFLLRLHRSATDYSYACLWRALSRHGLRPGDRRVYVWGRSFLFNSSAAQRQKIRLRQKVRNWLNNTMAIDAYELTHRNVDQAIEAIQQFRPIYLHGYVSALYTIARRMVETNRSFRNFRPLAVITESEKLFNFQQETMQHAFGCKILEHYGSVECGNIAQPDPEGHMRIAEDLYKLETLANGELLVTNLLSLAYPLIRYRQGDMAEIADSPNDRLPYAVITKVIGRTVDLIPVRAGGYVHGVALAHVIDPHLRFVKKYQVHQLSLDYFKVKLIADSDMPESVPQKIAMDLRLIVGANARVEVERVDEISPATSGKFRWVVSDISDIAERSLTEGRGNGDKV
jgi:phenylacetate-coenzyme A ligase PaaK-like adenylate-forming protein